METIIPFLFRERSGIEETYQFADSETAPAITGYDLVLWSENCRIDFIGAQRYNLRNPWAITRNQMSNLHWMGWYGSFVWHLLLLLRNIRLCCQLRQSVSIVLDFPQRVLLPVFRNREARESAVPFSNGRITGCTKRWLAVHYRVGPEVSQRGIVNRAA